MKLLDSGLMAKKEEALVTRGWIRPSGHSQGGGNSWKGSSYKQGIKNGRNETETKLRRKLNLKGQDREII